MMSRTLIASLLVLLLSTTAIATTIDYEASFNSIDVSYRWATKQLKFEQNDVVLVLEGPGQMQRAMEHLNLVITATMTRATSIGGKAEATFRLDLLSIIDPSDPSNPLLTANGGVLHVEESSSPLVSVLTFTGEFWDIAKWGFGGYGWDNPGGGEIFALAWKFGNMIDNFFTENLNAESSVTLIPEPVTAAFLLAGGPIVLLRRRKTAQLIA